MTDTVPEQERPEPDLDRPGDDRPFKPDTDRIIEIAVVVTDPQLTVRVEGPVFAIHQTDAVLDGMDNWNKGTHGKSGLIDR
jgi:oligoribonuclease (3'-5' exoribonuclease)